MQHITNFTHTLEVAGIQLLTGEACAYSMRLLFDYNEAGQKTLQEFLATPLNPADPWNASPINGQPRVGSIMLSLGIVRDLTIFILLVKGYHAVGLTDGTLIEVDPVQDREWWENEIQRGKLIAHYGEARRIYLARKDVPGVSVGSRNIHQMSGRVS